MYTQAIGYGIRSTILAAARQGLFLIPTLLVLPNVWGLRGLEVCQPLADVLTLALAVWMMTKVIRGAEGANGAGNRVKALANRMTEWYNSPCD